MLRFLVFICVLCNVTSGLSQSKQSLVSKRTKTKKELIRSKSKLNQLKKEKTEETHVFNQLTSSIRKDKAFVVGLNQKVDSLVKSSQNKMQTFHHVSNELQKNNLQKRKYVAFLHKSYLNKKTNHSIQIFKRVDKKYISSIIGYFNRIQHILNQLKDELLFTLCRMKNEENVFSQMVFRKKIEINYLDSIRMEKISVLKNLHKKERRLSRSISVQQQQIDKLNKRIERIIYLQMRKSKKSKKSTKSTKSNSAFAKVKGNLSWPVESKKIVVAYGKKEHPDHPGIYTNNNGIDIACSKQEPIKAVFDGEVVGVFTIPGMQQAIMIKHNDFFTTYSNIANVCVKKGQQVKRMDTIAKSAIHSESGTYRLHFEIWYGKNKQNPSNWLK